MPHAAAERERERERERGVKLTNENIALADSPVSEEEESCLGECVGEMCLGECFGESCFGEEEELGPG